jgi:hypothetical protein
VVHALASNYQCSRPVSRIYSYASLKQNWANVLTSKCEGRRVQIELDNSAVVRALESIVVYETASANDSYSSDRRSLLQHHISMRARFVVGAIFNLVADALSHNDVTQAKLECRAMFVLPPHVEQEHPYVLS